MKYDHGEMPILLLGETRRAALEKRIGTIVQGWSAEWATPRELTVQADTAANLLRAWNDAHSLRWKITTGASSVVAYVLCRTGFPAELLGMNIVGIDAHPSMLDAEIATSLQSQLAESLCKHIAGQINHREGTGCVEDAATVRDYLQDARLRRWQGISVHAGMGRPLAVLLLDPNIVAKLLPAAAVERAAEKLEKRGSAVRGNAVTVEAVLGDADVMFAELANLAVDDVIVLNQALSAPAHVVSNGVHVANAHLGQVGTNRAVSLVG